MNRLFFLAALLSLGCSSCKSKKEAGKTNSTPPVSTTTSTEPATETKTTIVYRLIVSFISKGAGIDASKREALIKYIESHPKKPAYKAVLWGREGENDFCLTLSELKTAEEINTFIEQVKKIAAGSDMMQISQNVESQHTGR